MIQAISKVEHSGALNLAWRVFEAYEAPEYAARGVREFRDFIAPETVNNRMARGELFMWGWFMDGKIVGVIATKPPCHIALLFVDAEYHRRGIAKSLYHAAADFFRAGGYGEATVNASSYAVEVYRKLGFTATGPEQTMNGICFTPMKHVFEDAAQGCAAAGESLAEARR